jgi:hypothetical protein
MGLLAWLDQRKRIKELEDGLETVRKEALKLQIEWAEVYDKVRHAMNRMAKRVERGTDDTAVVESTQEVPQPNNGGATALGGRLSDHQKQVQQQILKRRAGL